MRAEMWPATGFTSGDSADAIPLAFCLVPKAGTRTVSHRHVVPDVGPNISRPDSTVVVRASYTPWSADRSVDLRRK